MSGFYKLFALRDRARRDEVDPQLNRPSILLSINDRVERVLLDTGADVSCVSRDALEKGNMSWEKRRGDGVLKTVDGRDIMVHGQVKVNIEFGGMLIKDQLVVVIDSSPSSTSEKWVIGEEILRNIANKLSVKSLYDMSRRNKWIHILEAYRKPENREKKSEVCVKKIVRENENWQNEIKVGDIPEDVRTKLNELLLTWESNFSHSEYDVGYCKKVEHHIRLNTDIPIKRPCRRIPHQYYEEAEEYINASLKAGLIQMSTSPFSAPIHFVRKNTGKVRVCIDYRALNKVTIKDAHPIPNMMEALDALAGAKWFSVFDLSHGFLQCELAPVDREKTAFSVGSRGLYEYKRMPMGLVNAPATFSRLMQGCLGYANLKKWVVYLDDIMVFASTIEEMMSRLQEMMDRLFEYGLKLKPSKCALFLTSVTYLGHIISEKGVSTDPGKIETISAWQYPNSVKQVRSFLGLASFYRRFIKDFSKIAQPLYDLTKEGAKFNFTDKHMRSFNVLKDKLVSSDVLTFPNFKKKFVLEVDASMSGFGAILSQEKKVISYASRSLRDSEKRDDGYSSMKLELAALRWAITEKFRDYLLGNTCIVYTDNNPLATYKESKIGSIEMRWISQLEQFDLEMKYRPGRVNKNADALSRKESHPKDIPYRGIDVTTRGIINTERKTINGETTSISPERQTERRTSNVRDLVGQIEGRNGELQGGRNIGEQSSESSGIASQVEQVDRMRSRGDIVRRIEEKTCEDILSADNLIKCQEEDEVLKIVKKCVENKTHDDERSREARQLLKRNLIIRDKGIYDVQETESGKCFRWIIPQTMRLAIMKYMHDSFGHQGSFRTYELVNRRVFWIGMRQSIHIYCKACKICALSKKEICKVPSGHIRVNKPLEMISMDFMTIEKSKSGHEHVLVITDIATKFVQAIPTKDQKANTVSRIIFNDWIVRFGIPEKLHSDRGRNFESEIIENLCSNYDIYKTRTTSYHPEGNGQCERMNRTLQNLLRTLQMEEKEYWTKHIPYLVFAYNCTPHSTTGYSPYALMFGRDPKLPIDMILGNDNPDEINIKKYWDMVQKNHIHEISDKKQEKNESEIPIGTIVYLRQHPLGRNKIQSTYGEEKFIIKEILSPQTYDIQPVIASRTRYKGKRVVHRRELRDGRGLDEEKII